MTLKAFFLVFLGGGTGSTLRYLFSIFFHSHTAWQSLLPNLLGCLLLGVLTNFMGASNDSTKLFFAIGCLGGLTTFSGYVGFIGQSGFLTVEAVTYFLLNNILGLALFLLALKGPELFLRG